MISMARWIIDVLTICSLALCTKAVSVNNCTVEDNCRYCRDGAIVVEDSQNPSKLIYGGGHCVLNSDDVCVDIYTHLPCSGDASTCPSDAVSDVMPEYLQPAWYQTCGDQKRNYVMGPAGCKGGVDSIGTCTPQYGITTTTTTVTTTTVTTTTVTQNTTTTSNSTTTSTQAVVTRSLRTVITRTDCEGYSGLQIDRNDIVFGGDEITCVSSRDSCGGNTHNMAVHKCTVSSEGTQVQACYIDRCDIRDSWSCSVAGTTATNEYWGTITCTLTEAPHGWQVVFAPFKANVVGVIDTSPGTFYASVSTGSLTMDEKFRGAAAAGTQVVFAPYMAEVVGLFDIITNSYSEVSTGLTMNYKFAGAAAVGTQVVFAPCMADVVGVFDTSTSSYSEVSTGLTNYYKFDGAAAVGMQVVFAPYWADVVGVFDTSTNSFSASVSTGALSAVDAKFSGAVAVGTQVVFAPHHATVVGVFDVSTSSFSASVSTGLTQPTSSFFLFVGAAAVGTQVVFAPLKADVIGVFDTSTSSFSSVPIGLTNPNKFAGAAAVGTQVMLTPYEADVVGVFDPSTSSYSEVSTGSFSMNYKFWGAAAVTRAST